jgi:hypothetical protein
LLNSRQGLFTAAPKRSTGLLLHVQGHSFSRSYGVILPSSLTRVLPVALVFSTRPPVSVCGTGTRVSLEAFLGSLGLTTPGLAAPHHPSGSDGGFPYHPHLPTGLDRNPITGWSTLLRHPIAQTTRRGTGILTRCPSPTTVVLGLGPTDPTRTNLASETLGLRRTRFSRVLRYSSQHSHFCTLQQSLRSTFFAYRTLPYRSVSRQSPQLRCQA